MAFILTDEIREAEHEKNSDTAVPTCLSRAAADHELSLIAELARSDFKRVMAFVRAMSDSGGRLRVFLCILDMLRQPSSF